MVGLPLLKKVKSTPKVDLPPPIDDDPFGMKYPSSEGLASWTAKVDRSANSFIGIGGIGGVVASSTTIGTVIGSTPQGGTLVNLGEPLYPSELGAKVIVRDLVNKLLDLMDKDVAEVTVGELIKIADEFSFEEKEEDNNNGNKTLNEIKIVWSAGLK